MLSIRGLTVEYHTPEGEPLPALGPVSLEIPPGEFVCLVGPSGCGKSTLIKVIAGLQPPTAGGAFLHDQPIIKPSPKVGLMFQDATLLPWRTVRDNIGLPLELAGMERGTFAQFWVCATALPPQASSARTSNRRIMYSS